MKHEEIAVFKIRRKEVSEKEAIKRSIYSKYIYSSKTQIDRIELLKKGTVFKVIYPERAKPFDHVFEKHRGLYSNTFIEINEKSEPDALGGSKYRAYIYDHSGQLKSVKDCFTDAEGKLIKENELNKNLEILDVYEYIYENGELSKVLELTPNGDLVGEQKLI